LALSLIVVLLAWLGVWIGVAVVVVILAFYLLAVRLTLCRVETLQHAPCRWLVRGVLGTCDWHSGLKRGLPRLVPAGWGALPRFMWPRHSLTRAITGPELQPQTKARGLDATAPDADRPAYDWIMMALTGIGILISLIALMREFAAG
jgi:hypothetical protein